MNSFTERSLCEKARGYPPITSAVSYAQSLHVVVPCSLWVLEHGRFLVAHELPNALSLLKDATQSFGLTTTFNLNDVVSTIAAETTETTFPRGGSEKTELTVSVDNLSHDFGGSEAVLGISFRDITSGSPGGVQSKRYTLCGQPVGMRSNEIPPSLSSYSAHLHYARRGMVERPGDVPIHFDSDGYLLGPEDGVMVAVTGKGIYCCSASRPVLACGTARRLSARRFRVVDRLLHISELVTVSRMGWVGPDFRLLGAELLRQERPQHFGDLFDGVPEDLANVHLQDDTYIPIREEN